MAIKRSVNKPIFTVESEVLTKDHKARKAYGSIGCLYYLLRGLGIKGESANFIKFHNNRVWFISKHLK